MPVVILALGKTVTHGAENARFTAGSTSTPVRDEGDIEN